MTNPGTFCDEPRPRAGDPLNQRERGGREVLCYEQEYMYGQ